MAGDEIEPDLFRIPSDVTDHRVQLCHHNLYMSSSSFPPMVLLCSGQGIVYLNILASSDTRTFRPILAAGPYELNLFCTRPSCNDPCISLHRPRRQRFLPDIVRIHMYAHTLKTNRISHAAPVNETDSAVHPYPAYRLTAEPSSPVLKILKVHNYTHIRNV
jgi:hypothetical protein